LAKGFGACCNVDCPKGFGVVCEVGWGLLKGFGACDWGLLNGFEDAGVAPKGFGCVVAFPPKGFGVAPKRSFGAGEGAPKGVVVFPTGLG
jgi:hypothetical protein